MDEYIVIWILKISKIVCDTYFDFTNAWVKKNFIFCIH